MSLVSPEAFFGFRPGTTGELYNWPDMIRYFEHLAANSPRVTVRHMGPTSDGNPFLAVYISAADTIADLEKYRCISMKLSDPEGLTPQEIEGLCKTGKVVCLQMSGLHAYELSPSQNSVALAYSLAAGGDPETLEILANTILILIPTANPDGLIDCWQWNEQVRGTTHNSLFSPHIYAKYTGHGNNRDNLYENIAETRYLNQLLYREWMPQVMTDQHQAYCGSPNFHFGCGTTESKLPQGLNPLLVRESQLLTSEIAYSFQEAGFRDVSANCTSYGHSYSHVDNARAHNIVSLLSEMLDTTFTADGISCTDTKVMGGASLSPTALLPDPLREGVWTRQEATAYIHKYERSLLYACARNRERLLRGMAAKAMQQTKRGAEDPVQAYVIPPLQHDLSAVHRLRQILCAQQVRFFEAKETVKAGNVWFPEGSLVIPCAQPKYMLLKNIFSLFKPQEADCNIHTNESEMTTKNLALLLGVEVHESPVLPQGSMAPVTEAGEYLSRYPLPAAENASYLHINHLLQNGQSVFYHEDTAVYTTEESPLPLRKAKIALFRTSRFLAFRWDQVGNDECPFTAMILDRYGFDWQYLTDKEVRSGIPEDIDILIIPGTWRTSLEQGDQQLEGYPEEYTVGLGKLGAEQVRKFVRRGGRLIAWASAAGWAINALSLRIQDGKKPVADGIPYWERHPSRPRYGTKRELSREDLCVCGPMLRVDLAKDQLTRGMPAQLPVLVEDGGPIMRVTSRMEDFPFAVDYETLGRYTSADTLHVDGEVRGLKFLEYASCIVRTHIDEGEVLLYSFDPKFRGQTECTFKLFFNALYL